MACAAQPLKDGQKTPMSSFVVPNGGDQNLRYGTLSTSGGQSVKGAAKERWMDLCEQADEQDVAKLLELTKEINRLLTEKENRLKAEPKADRSA